MKSFLRRERDERGAVAIIVAAMTVLLLMFAAYAVDIGTQINRKHQLQDTLDAAAQAGAFALPGSATQANTDALNFAKAHDPTETGSLAPSVDFWCVVASKQVSGVYQVDTTQVPSTCYPGPAPYTAGANYSTTGRKVTCSPMLCAIPCVEPTPNTGTPKVACNTIRVYQGRDVPFAFAPAGGILKGSTGNLLSVACKGSCGTVAPNPMDVAVVADRTGSMSGTDVNSMISGINAMLQEMTPSEQYVSLGTIGRASVATTPASEPGGSCPSSPSASAAAGAWMSVPFSDNYLSGASLNSSSALVKAINCLTTQSSTGTALAAPMKAAARYLLGTSVTNNLSALPVRSSPATKMLIFETDGQPNETPPTGGATDLNSSSDPFSNNGSVGPPVVTTQSDQTTVSGGVTTITHRRTESYTTNGGLNACNNLGQVAANAKAAGITVVMIAYNLAGTNCHDSDVPPANDVVTVQGPEADTATRKYKTQTTRNYAKPSSSNTVLNVMGAAASPVNGVPSAANNACSTVAERSAENADGDYFFCAASGTDMAPIFKTALSQTAKGIKLLRLP